MKIHIVAFLTPNNQTLTAFLYPRRESNPYRRNRNPIFYPLNYEGRKIP